MKILRMRFLVVVGVILCAGFVQTAFPADRFGSLCREAPVIVRARILNLVPGTSISDASTEFQVEAEVVAVAKGDLKQGERIEVVIKLLVRDSGLLRDTPFGMSKGGDFILFLRPRYAAYEKTLLHYSFTETPLGCLPHDFYTWKRIERAIDER